MACFFVSVALCISVSICLRLWWTSFPKNLPPGPLTWPILGSLPNFGISLYKSGLQPHQLMAQLSKHYGKVYSFYLGNQLVVILNSAESTRAAFQNQHIADRPKIRIPGRARGTHGIGEGVVMASGEPWKQQRRFTLSTFRSFGVGKRRFQDQISIEVQALCEEISSFEGKRFAPRKLLTNAVANIICTIVIGNRFDYSDKSFNDLLNLYDKQQKAAGSGLAEAFIPILRYLKLSSKSDKERYQCNQQLGMFYNGILDEHHKALDPNDLRDYIDVYLDEINKAEDGIKSSSINKNNLIATIHQLFSAGVGTTVGTLRWALLYMIAYPDIQARIQREIDDVVGRNRLPHYSDQDQMPYTQATLMEIARIASIAPFGIPHVAAKDTTLFGYNIPQNTIIMSNIWAIHHDPDAWKDPELFRPERFLDGDRLANQREEFLPFGVGRRVCLGENLARMELFLFFSHLLCRFTFKKPRDSPALSFEGVIGAANTPSFYETEAILRD